MEGEEGATSRPSLLSGPGGGSVLDSGCREEKACGENRAAQTDFSKVSAGAGAWPCQEAGGDGGAQTRGDRS